MRSQDISRLSKKFQNEGSVKFSFQFPGPVVIKSINSLLAKILFSLDLIFLLDTLVTILREFIFNAAKANTKRIYFREKNLNINDPADYSTGIQKFKDEIVGDVACFEKKIKNSDYVIVMSIKKEKNGIEITITNNAPIHLEELKRINLRKTAALNCENFTDIYDEASDDTEGAGLGIVLVTFLLKNSGINAEKFHITGRDNKTQAMLEIPYEPRPQEVTSKIKALIKNQIYGLPTFPANIMELQGLCSNPDADIDMISEKIKIDPALTSNVLKISNSAGFITGNRIETLNEAIMTIGLKNVSAILVATGARKILDTRFKKLEFIWAHCNLTANYARKIAGKFKLKKSVENAFLAGLLHDLGKIILLSTNLDLVNHISDLVKNREIRTSTVMEEIAIGISHSAIGELITKKWNFPDFLVEGIKHHHSPLNAKKEFQDVVFTTYLANMLCGIESGKYNYYYIEEKVLEKFNITGKRELESLHNSLKSK